jgi:hyperosmotically inducible protein
LIKRNCAVNTIAYGLSWFGNAPTEIAWSRHWVGHEIAATLSTIEDTDMNKYRQTPFWGIALLALAFVAGCNKSPEAGGIALPSTSNAANVGDVDVTTNVKTALLQDAALKRFDINVITLKGDVRLIGVVDTQSQIEAAVKLARGAAGVHSIHDELTVKK